MLSLHGALPIYPGERLPRGGGQDALRDRIDRGIIEELRAGGRDIGEILVEPRIHLQDMKDADLLFLRRRRPRPAGPDIIADGPVDVDPALVDRDADGPRPKALLPRVHTSAPPPLRVSALRKDAQPCNLGGRTSP